MCDHQGSPCTCAKSESSSLSMSSNSDFFCFSDLADGVEGGEWVVSGWCVGGAGFDCVCDEAGRRGIPQMEI